MKDRRTFWILCFALSISGIVMLTIYELATFRIRLTPITEEDTKPFSAIGKLLETTERRPNREVDDTSVGFPDREQRLRVIGQLVHVFEIRFGHLPESLEDLIAIPTSGPKQQRAKDEIKSAVAGCQLFHLSVNSYLLNCDGWNPDERSLLQLEKTSDRQKVRFYSVDQHVVLSVPPPVLRP
jgi:hypothetical protein